MKPLASRPPSLHGLLVLAGLLCSAASVSAFANAPLGSSIDNQLMPTLDGGQEHLLSDATANIFVFFKPGQPHSQSLIKELETLQKETAGKSVRWVAVVSGRLPSSIIRQAGLTMPVLIDQEDALYGHLGVALEPVVGIADGEHRLIAYQPYTKINFIAVLRARIQHLLKEIDDATLARVLTPPRADNGGQSATAHRRYKLAQKLFQAKQYTKALENIALSLEKDGNAAASHALHGHILVAIGDTEGARAAYGRALQLDPADEATRAASNTLPPHRATP